MKCIEMKLTVAAMLVEAVQSIVLVSGHNHVAEDLALLVMEGRCWFMRKEDMDEMVRLRRSITMGSTHLCDPIVCINRRLKILFLKQNVNQIAFE